MSMIESPLSKERQAVESLGRLLDDAEKVRCLFVDAGMSLPEPLARLFGSASAVNQVAKSPEPTLLVNIPRPEKRPPESKADWIWVPVKDLSTTALLLAVLRSSEVPIPSKEAIDAVSSLKAGLNPGSIFNIASRLSGRPIERSGDGWKLRDRDQAPLIYEGYGWGPASVFGKQELAAHRRLLIRNLLSANQYGLQVMQIVSQLEQCGQCRAPVNKDLLKGDMEVMQKEGLVRHRGNSKKWELTEQSGG